MGHEHSLLTLYPPQWSLDLQVTVLGACTRHMDGWMGGEELTGTSIGREAGEERAELIVLENSEPCLYPAV